MVSALTFEVPAAFATGYVSEDLAIAAAPVKTADKARIGYITVLASASTWVAGTDAFAGGTGGNPATTTNYYNIASPWQLTADSANAIKKRTPETPSPEPSVVEHRAPDQDAALEKTFEDGTALDILPPEDRRHAEPPAAEVVDGVVVEVEPELVREPAPEPSGFTWVRRGDGTFMLFDPNGQQVTDTNVLLEHKKDLPQ